MCSVAKDENNPDGEFACRNQRNDIIKLHVGEQNIETTDNHPFWVEGKGSGFADELQVGDKLQKAGGSNLTIDKVVFVKLNETGGKSRKNLTLVTPIKENDFLYEETQMGSLSKCG